MSDLLTEQAYRQLNKANQYILQQSYKEAARYLIMPVKEGIPEALTNMGTLRFKGLGLQKDIRKALYWYRLAARKGCKTAIYNLSICYRFGFGTERNVEKGLTLLYNAAKLGLVSAEYQLGKMCQIGEQIEQSSIKAIFWYKKAADRGHAQAQIALAALYKCELPQTEIEQDLIKAHLYANLALHNGSQEAKSLLNSIEEIMVGRQLEIAKRLYLKWGRNFVRGYGYSSFRGHHLYNSTGTHKKKSNVQANVSVEDQLF